MNAEKDDNFPGVVEGETKATGKADNKDWDNDMKVIKEESR